MSSFKKQLLATTIFCDAVALLPGAALAQEAATQPDEQAVSSDAAESDAPSTSEAGEPAAASGDAQPAEIVVTGSILRRTTAETPSPVTIVTAESMEQRGINTVSE